MQSLNLIGIENYYLYTVYILYVFLSYPSVRGHALLSNFRIIRGQKMIPPLIYSSPKKYGNTYGPFLSKIWELFVFILFMTARLWI